MRAELFRPEEAAIVGGDRGDDEDPWSLVDRTSSEAGRLDAVLA